MRLEGKVAIITGANSGVGEETAKRFAKEGAKVVICARRVEALNKAKEEIEKEGGVVLAVPCDISSLESVQNLFEQTMKTFGKIDILVNNAGVLEEGLKPISQYTDEDYEKVTNINQKGTLQVTREACKYMELNNGGSIVNVASVAGYYGCGGAVYASTKGAMIALTKHIAMRYAGTKSYIRCNAICPGTIITPMTTTIDRTKLNMDMFMQMGKHADIKNCPPCFPADCANTILFLASDESKALTGQILVHDFGADL